MAAAPCWRSKGRRPPRRAPLSATYSPAREARHPPRTRAARRTTTAGSGRLGAPTLLSLPSSGIARVSEPSYLAAVRQSYDTVAADYAALIRTPAELDPL